MNRDHAERIAATSVEALSVDSARTVIAKFVTELARCPVCDGSGRFTLVRDIELPFVDNLGRPVAEANRIVRAGAEVPCPRCGSMDNGDSGKGDPEHVAWHCTVGDGDDDCRRARRRDGSVAEQHERCGYRLVLELPNPAG